jgi:hypothetical protein
MVLICEGTRTKQEVVNETLEEYREMYVKIKQDFDVLVEVRGHLFFCFLPSCLGTKSEFAYDDCCLSLTSGGQAVSGRERSGRRCRRGE